VDECEQMGSTGESGRHRVFVPQALGSDEFLRVTWHESRQVLVFSHWQGARCLAATPVRVADLAELAQLTAAAVAQHTTLLAWPPPEPNTLVVPAAGLSVPQLRHSA
jgi:hypothetical protein